MMSRSAIILFAVFLCVPAVMVRRQAEDSGEDQEFDAAPGWDAFSRDKTDLCVEMGNDGKDFCRSFDKCCESFFDRLNGDRCQTKEQSCESPEVNTCVYRNCTEMITTTTTTEAPTTEEQVNAGERIAAWVCSIAVVLALH